MGGRGDSSAARLWGEGAELARPSFRNLRALELDKQTGPAAGERKMGGLEMGTGGGKWQCP